jgi:hypothetical protein
MIQTQTWNLPWIGNLITALATLAGVYLGQRSTRRLQHEQWLLDHRRAECKELLEALTAAYLVADKHSMMRASNPAEAQEALYRIVHNRLFIAKELREENFWSRWKASTSDLMTSAGYARFTSEYAALTDFMIKLANTSKV